MNAISRLIQNIEFEKMGVTLLGSTQILAPARSPGGKGLTAYG
jgi:hypothetical protein